MKKSIVVITLILSMLANTAFAGGHHGGGINPLWIPVAVLSTLAAITTIAQPPVVYERRAYYQPEPVVVYQEPRQVVIYDQPRYYRHERPYERHSSYDYNDDRYRRHEGSRYYRDYR